MPRHITPLEAAMSNEEQIEYWNGEGGERWAAEDARMARLLEPVAKALLEHADILGCTSALDVGCGGGSQSVLLAQHLGKGASVTGVDISGPMLAVAREKLGSMDANSAFLQFLQADASQQAFDAATFDLVFSRFGVMFFDDPVAAFSNIRGGLRDDARLAFCCWRAVAENPWVTLSMQAVLQFVPPPEKTDPNAPGPFAFADSTRVGEILQQAGFGDLAFYPYDSEVTFSEAPTLGEAVRELIKISPVGRLLADQSKDVVEAALGALEETLAPYYTDSALRMPTAIWFVTGRVN